MEILTTELPSTNCKCIHDVFVIQQLKHNLLGCLLLESSFYLHKLITLNFQSFLLALGHLREILKLP